MARGLFQSFSDTWILAGVHAHGRLLRRLRRRQPDRSGIKVAREVCQRSGIAAGAIDTVLAGNMAPGGFDQFYLPRHIGLYAGVPCAVGAIMVQRICGTGFELFRQAGEQIAGGAASLALVVGTESMTRNPIAAFEHRQGFKLGMAPQFKDHVGRRSPTPRRRFSMIHTAENLAKKYGITREAVDAFASQSLSRARWRRRRRASSPARSCRWAMKSSSWTATSRAASASPAKAPLAERDTHRASPPPRCGPSCARCSRTACRPAATARR